MSVYMGDCGTVLLKRTAAGEGLLSSALDPNDVNVSRKRFSFDFPAEALISGDRIEIYTDDKSNLELVSGHNYPDGEWFCHIDDVGGVRLYNEFEDAVNGGIANALTLVAPTSTQNILVRTRNSRFRCIAQMRNWEITTSRQQVDTTVLGEEFVSQFSRGLISGQGSIDCIWEYKKGLCDSMIADDNEVPHYLCELLLRLKQGAGFRAQFYLFSGAPEQRSVWYEADCVVTSAGLNFAPGEVVGSRVDFVTTGAIDLHIGTPDGFILQEDTDLLLQEDGDGLELEDVD